MPRQLKKGNRDPKKPNVKFHSVDKKRRKIAAAPEVPRNAPFCSCEVFSVGEAKEGLLRVGEEPPPPVPAAKEGFPKCCVLLFA